MLMLRGFLLASAQLVDQCHMAGRRSHHMQLLKRSRSQLAQAGTWLDVIPHCKGFPAEDPPQTRATNRQDAGQRCTSQSHQVLREGLPPAIPEGVHKYFVVLDGYGADSGVQVKGSPAPRITLKAAPQQISSAGHYCALHPCKAAL